MEDFFYILEVERGIPVTSMPTDTQSKYPFHDMEIGDSFAVCVPDPSRGNEVAKKVRTAAGQHAIRHGKAFTVRRVPDLDGMYTIRCWRIEPEQQEDFDEEDASDD